MAPRGDSRDPPAELIFSMLGLADYRSSTVDQQSSQISITAFTDTQ
jgi:hypothetical protein